jgi:hypothetical protein
MCSSSHSKDAQKEEDRVQKGKWEPKALKRASGRKNNKQPFSQLQTQQNQVRTPLFVLPPILKKLAFSVITFPHPQHSPAIPVL